MRTQKKWVIKRKDTIKFGFILCIILLKVNSKLSKEHVKCETKKGVNGTRQTFRRFLKTFRKMVKQNLHVYTRLVYMTLFDLIFLETMTKDILLVIPNA